MMSTPDYMSDWQETDEGLMTRREVADYLSVSTRTIQRMDARGTLTRITVRGLKLAFYRASEVKALISDGQPREFRLLKRGEWG